MSDAPWFSRFGSTMYGPDDGRAHRWPDFRCPDCGTDHSPPTHYCPTCGDVFWAGVEFSPGEVCYCGHSLARGAPTPARMVEIGGPS